MLRLLGRPWAFRRVLGMTGGGGLRYLLRDEFTTDRAAGAVNGTLAEPGPGTRTVLGTHGTILIESGLLKITGANTSYGDPVVSFGGLTRTAGRVIIAKVTYTSSTGPHWGITPVGTPALDTTEGTVASTGNQLYVLGNVQTTSPGTQIVAIVLRATGAYGFWYTESKWRLASVYSNGSTADLLLLANMYSSTATGMFDYIRVPVAKWLPTPLLSDGFASAFGTSDGLGHAEGVAGGIGAGGSGVTLSNAGGTWSVSGGKAINTAPSGLVQELGIANLSCSDVYAGVSVVRALGNEVGLGLCWDSDSSPANGLKIHSDGAGNIKVDKYVAGVKTNVSTTAFTYSAGARLVSTMNAGALRTYYNGALVKADTIVDAAILTGTHHGGYSNGGVSTLDDLTVYATGTGGEYSQLDSY